MQSMWHVVNAQQVLSIIIILGISFSKNTGAINLLVCEPTRMIKKWDTASLLHFDFSFLYP